MTIERIYSSGGYRVSDIIKGQLVTRVYLGYTKQQATRLFRREVKGM